MPLTASNDAFLDAWKRAVALAGFEFFGDGTPSGCAVAADKNQLRPRWQIIEDSFAELTEAEQIFLANLLTFFNSDRGGWPVKKYVAALPNASIGHAAARLDKPRRESLAQLLTTYTGW